METKDILIFAFVFLALGIRLYMNYTKKKKKGIDLSGGKPGGKGGQLHGQPDDYEPYSKR